MDKLSASRATMLRSGPIYMGAGLGLGVALALVVAWIPGGGAHFLRYALTARLALPLSLALIVGGAIVTRMEKAEERRRAFQSGSSPETNDHLRFQR
jgi:hypothetical protein